jgi:hypothetical protein
VVDTFKLQRIASAFDAEFTNVSAYPAQLLTRNLAVNYPRVGAEAGRVGDGLPPKRDGLLI